MLNTQVPFTIYNASAGSGKTYTLVKEYLKLILTPASEGAYKNLLAITFTNKAVAEMKQRIISNLVSFSETKSLHEPSQMLMALAEETNQDIPQIHEKSIRVLKHLLHHYASFSVDTIDRFNHQLIRTFARDLKLPTNFEVTLDTQQLLTEAVDSLLSKAGESPEITKVLLDFVLEKTDDERSWDIARDIVKASEILFNENEAPHVEKLKGKSLADFKAFSNALRKKIKALDAEISEKAKDVLSTIEFEGLERLHFSSGYFFDHFIKLKEGRTDINFKTKWITSIHEKPLYSGKVQKSTPEIASIIDTLTPNFILKVKETKEALLQKKLFTNALRNLVPLSVLNMVQKEVEVIKEEKNVLPIAEFNALINKEIKNQPAPFIYERLGERYRHFFIDEFQDTSQMQWENLIPLIDNALSQQTQEGETGSLLLVGDAKQSIYRWRGGLPEQFIDLYHENGPFTATIPSIENLPTNYRSFSEIVQFNNTFFSHIATYFGNAEHQELYQVGNNQHLNKKETGYVQIEFVETENRANKDDLYTQKVHQCVLEARANKFEYRDICILTRSKKDGVVLGQYLLENNIPVISQETLLLQSSATVCFLMNMITLSCFPENDEIKIKVLDFLYDFGTFSVEKHPFLDAGLKASDFSEFLTGYNILLDFKEITAVSIYEACEYVIRQCKLNENPDAFLFGFLDFVYDFELQPQTNKLLFLEHWEAKKDSASIAASEQLNAVQLMTIHKAKGLEFPVVIFPYANVNIYKEIEARTWFPLDESTFAFEEARIHYNKEVAEYGPVGEAMFTARQNTLELDAFNLLYVTLTRPVEQLYIIAEKPSKVSAESPKNFTDLFVSYLQSVSHYSEDSLVYSFGKQHEKQSVTASEILEKNTPTMLSSALEEHTISIVTAEASLWDTEASIAIEQGNLLHDTMAMIYTKEDATTVLSALKERSIVSQVSFEKLEETIHAIISHPELRALFETSEKIINERDIITEDGMLLRPDRLNIHDDNTVTILDYKTGDLNIRHADQINRYAIALEAMGFKVAKKVIVYAHSRELVINKV
ncbi:UvrD-helicase domain-containing protein [Jejudonia soesokkakensis]|uniref:DNA 3'-5' helicase n=1 Tax=Jejudonia soesokkakensis TaxID=1323432 RepID=A0ABW2MRU8_9FLAO